MKLLVLLLCISLQLAAQQDPVYLGGMQNNLYYNFAGDNNGSGLVTNACYRNQSGHKQYASQAGYINAAYLGRWNNMLHAFSYEFDHLDMSTMQYIGWSEAFNIVKTDRYKLRMGLRLNAFNYRMRYDVFSEEVLGIPYITGYVFHKWTFSPDAVIAWQGNRFLAGAGIRNATGVSLQATDYPAMYRGQTSRTFYGFASYTAEAIRSHRKTVFSLSAMHQQPQEGQLIFYDYGQGVPYNPANENRYVYYRNGDVPFSMQVQFEQEIGHRLIIGVTGRGFHESMMNAGVSANYRLNDFFRLSALVMAPKKEQGLIVETKLEMRLVNYGRRVRPPACSGDVLFN